MIEKFQDHKSDIQIFPVHLHTIYKEYVNSICGTVFTIETNLKRMSNVYCAPYIWKDWRELQASAIIRNFLQCWHDLLPSALQAHPVIFNIENIPREGLPPLAPLVGPGLVSVQIFHPLAANRYIDPFTGLSGAGKKLLHELDAAGMFLDLSHLSGPLLQHVLHHAPQRRIVSHVVCADLLVPAVTARANAMTREELLACDAALYGIPFLDDLLSTRGTENARERDASIPLLARHIARMAEVVGLERVALGPDFFDAEDCRTHGVNIVDGLETPAGLVRLRECLLEQCNLTEGQVEAIFSRNALRVLGGS